MKFAGLGADPQTLQFFAGSARAAGGIERLCIPGKPRFASRAAT
jgi:hypothetical protein